MKFCTQVPRTYVHKRSVLGFHLFAKVWSYRPEFQTVFKIHKISSKSAIFKENGSYQTCSSIQGTQITGGIRFYKQIYSE